MQSRRGFTLIELLVVLAIVAMLLSIVAPRYMKQADKAKDAVLRENLASLRLAIDQYYGDRGHYPVQLEQLVEARYLRRVPIDPITGRYNTWRLIQVEGEEQGIYDVKSGAEGQGMDGTVYNTW
jgi:general secretion pathway protein G